MRKSLVLLIFFVLSATFSGTCQESQNSDTKVTSERNLAVKVFLDCSFCDSDFIRREMPFVNFVRDRKEAQVHILVTRQSTGSGGRQYIISLIGDDNFQGIEKEVVYTSNPDDTSDLIRQGITNYMAMGLMEYVAQTPLAKKISFQFDTNGHSDDLHGSMVEDNWKSWVFDIDMSLDYEQQETYVNPETEIDVRVEKVTPEWKVEFATGNDYILRKYIYEDTVYISNRNRTNFYHLLVKSLNDHWSAGGRVQLSSDTYQNTRFAWSVYPAIEYNIFPYYESSRKQFRIQYRAGYGGYYYRDTTIFNKLEENLFGHQLSIAYEIRQPWGSVNTSLSAFSYLPNLRQNNIQFWSWVNVRLFKGLSLRLSGRAAWINDQISLPKADATPEEVLLRQRQLATQYSYSFMVGFNYTFGSIYNNVVNPRFGD